MNCLKSSPKRMASSRWVCDSFGQTGPACGSGCCAEVLAAPATTTTNAIAATATDNLARSCIGVTFPLTS
jgi:hypothetical protein